MGYGLAVSRFAICPVRVPPRSMFVFRLALLVAFVAFRPSTALAHKNGINTLSCVGCHTGGKPATVTLTADPMTPTLGQMVTLTITISQTNGPTAGFYLTSDFPTPGTFKAVEAGTTATTVGATHSMPRTGSGGVTTFKVGWSSAVATGVQFSVAGLSANGDGTSKGDGEGDAHLSLVTGCAGMTYYIDQDADGYGTSDPRFLNRKECTQPPGYSANVGDCNDLEQTIHPGAAEVCNGMDDNCDGVVDEGTNLSLCGAATSMCIRGTCSPPGPGGSGSNGSGGSSGFGSGGAGAGTFGGSGGRSGGVATGGSQGRDAGAGSGTGTGGRPTGSVATGGATSVDPIGSSGTGGLGQGQGTGQQESPDAGVNAGGSGGAGASAPTGPSASDGSDATTTGGCAVGSTDTGSGTETRDWPRWWQISGLAGLLALVRIRARARD